MRNRMKRIAYQFTLATIIIGLVNWLSVPAFFTPTATQAAQAGQAQSPEISIIITQNVVRFVAQGEALEWRLEVINQRGELFFDSGLANGASLEWPLLNQQGQAIESGLYAYTLTTKAATDEAARSRRGHLIVDRASSSDRVWVTSSQEAGLGAGSEATKLTVISDARTTIGGVELQAAAPPRASPGERSALPRPTSLEEVKQEKQAGGTESSIRSIANISGSGTTNRLTKWLDGPGGVVGDSAVSEVGGNVGIGTTTPTAKLDVRGNLTLDPGSSPILYTGTGNGELSRYLQLINSQTTSSASGLKAGGILVADTYSFANPGKNDLIVKGNVGIGTANPGNGKLHVEGGSQAGVFSSSSVFGVYGYNTSSNIGAGVYGAGPTGVRGESGNGVGVVGAGITGVRGESDWGNGVVGVSTYSIGASGTSYNSIGVFGESYRGTGVYGSSQSGLAGYFTGNVRVTGSLSKGGGSFKIDHPLDPANKYLSHSFVESPDMLNIYNGNVALDHNGEAVVELPEWFGALNRDFRYQLTCVGGFAPIYVAEKIRDNRFKIAGGRAGLEVSWQVTGIRQDAWANAHRIPVEEMKPEPERGRYLHPTVYEQPEEKGIELARRPVNGGKK